MQRIVATCISCHEDFTRSTIAECRCKRDVNGDRGHRSLIRDVYVCGQRESRVRQRTRRLVNFSAMSHVRLVTEDSIEIESFCFSLCNRVIKSISRILFERFEDFISFYSIRSVNVRVKDILILCQC